MVTITLPPELEQVVSDRARQQGTTPELLALDALRNQLLPQAPMPAVDGDNLADFLGDFVGCIRSSEVVPGGARFSEHTGDKFAAGMVGNRRDGRL